MVNRSIGPRDALRASNHREASDLAKSLTGKGISQQAYALRKKILEVDEVVRPGDPIYEVHPEVSFWVAIRGGAFEAPISTGTSRVLAL